MFAQFKRVGKPPPHQQSVLTARVVGTDLLDDEALVVLIERDPLDETVHLFAFWVEVDLTFLIEESLATALCSVVKFLRRDDQFW